MGFTVVVGTFVGVGVGEAVGAFTAGDDDPVVDPGNGKERQPADIMKATRSRVITIYTVDSFIEVVISTESLKDFANVAARLREKMDPEKLFLRNLIFPWERTGAGIASPVLLPGQHRHQKGLP